MRAKETICALCTPKGRGAISLIRISGPSALKITRQLAPFLPQKPEARKAYLGFLKKGAELLDQALVIYFPQGKSFTGEESLEISCHGGTVYQQILEALIEKGARPAPPGGFSLQAFSNGRMDLVQAEGLLQLIESRSSAARQQALLQLKGEVSKKFKSLEKSWLFLLSHIEADIDFSMEGLETLSDTQIKKHLRSLEQKLSNLSSNYMPFERLQKGLVVGIFGPINSGKSSLFNALIERDKAIVSEEEGSTRDPVEATILNPKGLSLCLKDSAGFPPKTSKRKIGMAEGRAQKKSEELFSQSDFKILVFDSSTSKKQLPESPSFSENLLSSPLKTFVVWTKKDLMDKAIPLKSLIKNLQKEVPKLKALPPDRFFLTSALRKEGVAPLREALLGLAQLKEREAFVISGRQKSALLIMEEVVKNCHNIFRSPAGEGAGVERDLLSLELRRGLSALYEILGRKIDDEILDQVFKEFCIGK